MLLAVFGEVGFAEEAVFLAAEDLGGEGEVVDGGVWLGRIFFFIFTTIVAYVYGYRKGVFKFD